jgi:hypothetical protein
LEEFSKRNLTQDSYDKYSDKKNKEGKKTALAVFNYISQTVQLEQEFDKTKKLLAEKEEEIEKLKDKNPEEYEKEKEDLIQQLNQANQRIKELEEYSANTDNKLRELYNYAKNGSSSGSSNQPNNNSNLKSQLT